MKANVLFVTSKNIAQYKLFKQLLFPALAMALLSGCGGGSNRITTVDMPKDQEGFETTEIITLTSSAKPKQDGSVSLKQLELSRQKDGEAQQVTNSERNEMVLVASTTNDEVKLLDFFVPEVNETPALSFKSTARSLVMLNPVLSGLRPNRRLQIFKQVETHSKFSELTELVENSSNLLDDKIIKLSMEIALDYVVDASSGNDSSTSSVELSASEINREPESEVNIEQLKQEFGFNFPSNECGDPLPKNKDAFPVNFYPVFIKYSENNLKDVRQEFCRDAYDKYRDGKEDKYIQISSFTSRKKAEAFADIMQNRFGSGEIGEPTTVSEPRSFIPSVDPIQMLSSLLISAAYAQVEPYFFDYQILSSSEFGFDYTKDWGLNRLWRDRLKLSTFPGKLRVEGSARIAEQILVLPSTSLNKIEQFKNPLNWNEIEDMNIGEKLIHTNYSSNNDWFGPGPVEVDFNKEMLSVSGEYEVIMSALSNYQGGNNISAVVHNSILLIAESLSVISTINTYAEIREILGKGEIISEITKNINDCTAKTSENMDLLECMLSYENFYAIGAEITEKITEKIMDEFLI
ncbi:MAG: hypothetical protein F6K16_33280, partial [Symploca sp. SIO2B6]|nr:hypothetical protein [Symploca sp. SIO2B6]